MNLSHVEQYFADILSLSQMKKRPRLLTLTNMSLKPSPQRLVEGRIVEFPDNVWFVGTANHDETTTSFADKTYDRAHVQELPSRPATVTDPTVPPDRSPIDVVELENAFAQAAIDHAAGAAKASEYLDTELADVLAKRFDIGWGSRLDEQLKRTDRAALTRLATVGRELDGTTLLRQGSGTWRRIMATRSIRQRASS